MDFDFKKISAIAASIDVTGLLGSLVGCKQCCDHLISCTVEVSSVNCPNNCDVWVNSVNHLSS